MPKNKLSDLRDHLFEQLENLKKSDNPTMEIHRAEAVAKVATQIINSAKLQLQFIHTIGPSRAPALTEQTTGFFQEEKEEKEKGLNTGKQLGPVRSIAGK